MAYLSDMLRKAKQQSSNTSDAPETENQDSNLTSSTDRILVESYGDTKIYQIKGDKQMYYETPSPRYRGEEKVLIESLLELAANSINANDKLLQTRSEKRARLYSAVMEIVDKNPQINLPSNAKNFYVNAVVREMAGFGLIDPLIYDDNLEEVMVIGVNKPVYVFHRKHDMLKTNIVFYNDKDIYDLIDRIARNVGRHIDLQSPMLDARLADGTRVNATIPPLSLEGSTLTLRKFRADPLSIMDLINYGTINPVSAAFLWMGVEGLKSYPANMLISGGTASGKTTMLNAVGSFIPEHERLITIEDTAEIRLPFEHLIRFESRPPSTEGQGEVSINMLLTNALRMRPDRIVVGEVRGEEAYTLFNAMNTGHKGSLGTVHANSAKETLVRLTSPPMNIPGVMLSALNFIVMQQRIYDPRKGLVRRVTEIGEVVVDEELNSSVKIIFQWNPNKDVLMETGEPILFLKTLADYAGLSVSAVRDEWKSRTELIENLYEKGIRDLTTVTNSIQQYTKEKV